MATGQPTETTIRVPFVDLSAVHAPLKEQLVLEFAELIDRGAFSNGPAVARFERAFAEYCESSDCVGVASGLDALRLGLLATGVTSGDEVIVPALTFVATVEAITQAGGKPVLVDIAPDDWCLDPAGLESAITPRTRAVVPVHLYGQMADMRSVRDVARRHGLAVVEDACQAHGATRDGLRSGNSGDSAAFSFYPGKNLGAAGDAGALTTDGEATAALVRALREHGQTAKYVHEYEGWTARLDTIQATVLLRKLPLLDSWNRQRRAAAAYYLDSLDGVGDLALPPVAPGSNPVWHLFVIRTQAPEDLGSFLRDRGIASGRHYPDPVHLTGAYAALGHPHGTFPVAEGVARECLSLPIYPGISEEQLGAVCDGVRAYFGA